MKVPSRGSFKASIFMLLSIIRWYVYVHYQRWKYVFFIKRIFINSISWQKKRKASDLPLILRHSGCLTHPFKPRTKQLPKRHDSYWLAKPLECMNMLALRLIGLVSSLIPTRTIPFSFSLTSSTRTNRRQRIKQWGQEMRLEIIISWSLINQRAQTASLAEPLSELLKVRSARIFRKA